MRVIHVLRKPLSEGSVAQNVLRHGTGAVNVDGCRVGTESRSYRGSGVSQMRYSDSRAGLTDGRGRDMVFAVAGRWPANLILQHLDGCRLRAAGAGCAPGCPVAQLDDQSGWLHPSGNRSDTGSGPDKPYDATSYSLSYKGRALRGKDSGGGASRFFKQVGGDADGSKE